MKIQVYKGSLSLISKSGIGRAINHQLDTLNQMGIQTTDKFSEADIVHINTIFPNSVAAALTAKLFRKKVIYYGHSTMEDFRNSFIGSNTFAKAFKTWIKFCYGLGDVIITPTNYSKKILDGYGIKPDIHVISNGIDTEFYSKDEEKGRIFRLKYGLEDEKVIISVGHLIERKGIIDFIEMGRQMPDCVFLWFGHTDYHLIPKKIVDAIKSAPTNVIFPGYVTREELRDAYCGADLFAFMSHEETEGIVVLEALACGIPTIVRDIPVYEDWLVDGVNVYKADSNEIFLFKAQRLLHGDLQSLYEEGIMIANNRSFRSISSDLKQVYNTLM